MSFVAVINEEYVECRAEVKRFDYTSLRRVRTRVRNSLPTPQVLRAEMRPDRLPDISAIRHFDAKLLKHVEVKERNLLPTLEGKVLIVESQISEEMFQALLYNISFSA